jgi:hypothetical protein
MALTNLNITGSLFKNRLPFLLMDELTNKDLSQPQFSSQAPVTLSIFIHTLLTIIIQLGLL